MYTPGPWEIIWDARSAINAGKKHVAMVNYWNCPDVDQRINDDEHEANARLIAAAPDLLEACKTVLEYIDETGVSDYPGDVEMKRVLQEAIAKAEGK